MCEERESAYPGHDCDCMSWEREDLNGAHITPPLDPDRHLIYEPSLQSMMQWQPPVPVSGWPAFDSGPEEREERERMLRLAAKRMKQDPVAALREWITIAGSQLGLKS